MGDSDSESYFEFGSTDSEEWQDSDVEEGSAEDEGSSESEGASGDQWEGGSQSESDEQSISSLKRSTKIQRTREASPTRELLSTSTTSSQRDQLRSTKSVIKSTTDLSSSGSFWERGRRSPLPRSFESDASWEYGTITNSRDQASPQSWNNQHPKLSPSINANHSKHESGLQCTTECSLCNQRPQTGTQ